MKKVTKILTLILVVVLVLSIFAGCSLVGRDIATYRSRIALTVDGQPITVGKLLDTYNNYYNNYYYYISAGYLDASQLLNMVMSSLIQQYMQIGDYVGNTANIVTPELALKTPHAAYLTQAEYDYCVKYVNYLAFGAFDQYVEDNISGKYDLNDPETEDTSRDFTEPDDLKGATSYVEYTYQQNFVNEDADEYFADYYPEFVPTEKISVESYVSDVAAQKRVDEFNDRLTDEEVEAKHEITVEEYVEIQQDTIKQYRETIQNNYGISLDEFLQNQLNDMIDSCIIAKWNYQAYRDMENDLEATLSANYSLKKDAQERNFKINDNFDSFITSLGSSSTIYTLPTEEADNYMFVKNILIPFTSAQTALLSAKLAEYGGDAEDPRYIELRNQYAKDIVAQYFDNDKYTDTDEGKAFEDEYFAKDTWFEDKKKSDDDDSLWKTKVNPFTIDGEGNLIVNPDGVLGQFLQDGNVKDVDDKDHIDVIIELMKRFNTDTAQHTAAFDYVVYVGDDWEDYSHSWVKEFYTAVNEDLKGDSAKEYTLCVSTYGVHIIYKSGKLSDKQYTFDYSKRLDTSDPNYTFFKSFFQTQMSDKTQEQFRQLQLDKLKDKDISSYIVTHDSFNKFCDDNGFTFDLQSFIDEMVSEL